MCLDTDLSLNKHAMTCKSIIKMRIMRAIFCADICFASDIIQDDPPRNNTFILLYELMPKIVPSYYCLGLIYL